jgi:hypothetical protein
MSIAVSSIGVLLLPILLPAPAQAEPAGRIIRTESRAKAEITSTDAGIMRLARKRAVMGLFRIKIGGAPGRLLRMTSFLRNRCEVVHTAVAGVR